MEKALNRGERANVQLMYSREKLKSLTITELEALARVLYNHTPRVARWRKEWEIDLKNIHNEIKRRSQNEVPEK